MSANPRRHGPRCPISSSDSICPLPLKGRRIGARRRITPNIWFAPVDMPDQGSARTYLVYANRDTVLAEHTHVGREFTHVITGAFTDNGGRYDKGDFACTDEAVTHTPGVTERCRMPVPDQCRRADAPDGPARPHHPEPDRNAILGGRHDGHCRALCGHFAGLDRGRCGLVELFRQSDVPSPVGRHPARYAALGRRDSFLSDLCGRGDGVSAGDGPAQGIDCDRHPVWRAVRTSCLRDL